MTLPDWSSPFAPLRFHETSTLLRTCPPLSDAHRLLLASQFVLLVPFHPLCFRTLSTCRSTAALPICSAWHQQVLLFHCLACVSVLPSLYRTSCSQYQFITAALFSQPATEDCFRCKWSSFRYLIEGSLAFNSITLT